MPKNFLRKSPDSLFTRGMCKVCCWPGERSTAPDIELEAPLAPVLPTRHWTLTGLLPTFFTAKATYPQAERYHAPSGALSVMPGERSFLPGAMRNALPEMLGEIGR